jgi:peptide deformylase
VSEVAQKSADESAEQIGRRQAALRQVRVFGDPVLREKAQPVTRFDDELAKLAQRMIGIMRDAPGIGLAATQVGVVRRLLVYRVDDDDPHALVNPEVEAVVDEVETAEEGCLSVPGIVVPVERPLVVDVRAQDLHGERLEFTAEGLEARVIQHELDHLDGVLILDRTTRQERAKALRVLREGELSRV